MLEKKIHKFKTKKHLKTTVQKFVMRKKIAQNRAKKARNTTLKNYAKIKIQIF